MEHYDPRARFHSHPYSHSVDSRTRDRDQYSRNRPTTTLPLPANAHLALRLPVPLPSDPSLARRPAVPIAVQQPTEIAHFSYDARGHFHADRSSLRFWSPPPSSLLPCSRASDPHDLAQPLAASASPSLSAPVREQDKPFLDLNSAFDQYDPSEGPGIEPLDNLLRGLVEHGVWSSSAEHNGISVVTWRGILTKLLVAPYNDRDGWELGMVRHKSTLFIHEHITPDRLAQEAATQRDPRRARMAYWGYRFEHLCTLAIPPSSLSPADLSAAHEQRTRTPLNPKVQYCSVIKTKIGNHRIILGAEVDCCLPPAAPPSPSPASNAPPPLPPHYVELKTHRLATVPSRGGGHGHGHLVGWRTKLLRIWAQSFLAGVPTAMVGFRNDHGLVRAVREYKTLQLPRGVRGLSEAQGGWDPNVCIQFAAQALDRLVAVVSEEAEGVEWMVRYVPKDRVVEVFKKTVSHGGGEKGGKAWENGRVGGVLPEWFKRGDKGGSRLKEEGQR